MDSFLGEFNTLFQKWQIWLSLSTLKNSIQLFYQIFKEQMSPNYTNYSREQAKGEYAVTHFTRLL